MKKIKRLGFAIWAIRDGQELDPLAGAVTAPIYPTSTYVRYLSKIFEGGI